MPQCAFTLVVDRMAEIKRISPMDGFMWKIHRQDTSVTMMPPMMGLARVPNAQDSKSIDLYSRLSRGTRSVLMMSGQMG